jgi:hypothetical protein
VMMGTLGLFFSTLFKRTGRATMVSLVMMVVLLIAPVFIGVVIAVLRNDSVPRWLIALSPISAVNSAILAPGGQQGDANPLSFIFLGGMLNQTLVPISQTDIPRPVYHYSLVIFIGMSIIFYFGAVGLVDPTHRWRLSRKQLLTGLAILLALIFVTTGGFLATANHYEWYHPAEIPAPGLGPVEVITPVETLWETQRVITPEKILSTPVPILTP